jgi:hypothetical protein
MGGAREAQQLPENRQINVNGAGDVEEDDVQQRVVTPDAARPPAFSLVLQPTEAG